MTEAPAAAGHHDKKLVALTSVCASGGMAAAKLVVGLLTGSLGLLSEAIHSLLDLASSTMTFFAVRVSDQPADAEHPYGHGKVEALSALFATLLLVLTSIWIIAEAVHRLMAATVEVEATWYAVVLVLVVMLVDVWRSRSLMRVAQATGSQALAADAMHYMSDILSSAAVLVGLGCVWFGWARGDAVAALVVAVVVLSAAWHLGRTAIEVLIDTAPAGIAEQVATTAAGFAEIVSVEHVRARPAGPVIFADVRLRVSRTLSLETVRDLGRRFTARLQEKLPGIDLRLEVEPLALDDETIGETVRAIAARRGLAVHDIDLRSAVGGRKYLNFDVELDEELALVAAHAIATELEREIARDLGQEVEVTSHLDPRRSRELGSRDLDEVEAAPIARTVAELATTIPHLRDVHHLRVGQTDGGLHLVCHCTCDDQLPLRQAHHASALLEQAVYRAIPGVTRIVVHCEPERHDEHGAPAARAIG